jgi:hypothetical protein
VGLAPSRPRASIKWLAGLTVIAFRSFSRGPPHQLLARLTVIAFRSFPRALHITPILPVPLEGPAYFVSHGGEAFPRLIVVLQGYGVPINLVSSTLITKKGSPIQPSRQTQQPINSFELTLPQGKFSALAANGNLCKPTKTETVKKKVTVKRNGKTVKVTRKVSEQVAAPLTIPSEFIAQNGAELKQDTPISVTGCPKAHKAAKKAKKKAKKGKGKRK